MPIRWYALNLQSNREYQAQKYMLGNDVEHFLPTYRTMSSRKDKSILLDRPLFPGYIFVRVEIPGSQKSLVLQSPGVCGFVGFSGAPAPVEDDVIESLQILTGMAAGGVRPHPLVKAGQRVRVADGPFRNAVGVLCDVDGQGKKLVVEVSFLGRAVAVPIDPEQVIPIL
jgi:transcription termination/antitermination protein NusG